jgi:hypothetical protein
MTPTFFTKELNDDIHAEEFKQYLPVNVNTSFDTLAPAIGDAEEKYIRPLLGDTLFSSLAAYYAAGDTSDETNNRVIARIQSAVLRAAYYENFALLAVTFSDTGVQDANGEYRAYRYQVESARDTLGRQAFEHLQLLYDELAASSLRTWSDDDPYNPVRVGSLFRTPHEFFTTVDMLPDYRLFARLRPQLATAERVSLAYVIGSTLAAELCGLPSTGRMADATLLLLARRYVAFTTLADAIMLLNAYVSSEGATLRTIKAEGAAGGSQVSPADIDTRQRLQKNYRAVANAAATDMLHYLRTHSDTYPEILEVVGADSNVRRRTPNNDGLKHSFRV